MKCFRKSGKNYEDPKYKRAYYGLGCTQVSYIKKFNGEYILAFTPILKKKPFNFFLCDVMEFFLCDNLNQFKEILLYRLSYMEVSEVFHSGVCVCD